MKKAVPLFYISLALGVCIIDQALKSTVRTYPTGAVIWRIPGLLEITHCTNPGAAFSMFSGQRLLILLCSIGLMLAVTVYLLRSMHLTAGARAALALLIGGGLGNLVDRIALNGVTDYINLRFIAFPVFNFADICITVSVAVLAIYLLTGRLDPHPENKTYESDH